MAHTTIEQFATELKMPSGALLEQLAAAGVAVKREGDTLTEQDKTRLLDYLRRQHGARFRSRASRYIAAALAGGNCLACR